MIKRAFSRIPILLAVLFFLGHSLSANAGPALGPNYFDYQVKLPPPPTSADEALRTLDARAQAMLETIACGTEMSYAMDKLTHGADEGSTSRVLAKLEWGAGHPDADLQPRVNGYCRFSVTLRWGDFNDPEVCKLLRDAASCPDADSDAHKAQLAAVADSLWSELIAGNLDTFKSKILEATMPGDSRSCRTGSPTGSGGPSADRSILASRTLDPYAGSTSVATGKVGAVQIDFAISQQCLIEQVASSLSNFVIPVKDGKQQSPGTDGAPCHLFGTVYGDWDMAERNLIRIAYLIKRYRLDVEGAPLHDAYINLRNKLLTLDRGPTGDTFNALFGCGNDAGHTGSPEDRATDRENTGKSAGNALGDLGWFLLMLALLLAVAALVGAVLVALGASTVAGAAATAATIVAALIFVNIPETENHLLGINTTKYLNNQLIIQELGSDDLILTGAYISDQLALKEWLLKRMQTYLQNDFIEYNARPYQRHAIESIRNIFDFAGDPGRPNFPDADLRNAAHLVLDYTAAKFAVGSNQGRRMVPYRRHRSDFAIAVDTDASGYNGLFDLRGSSDHQVSLGLLYSGQTQQLPLGQASRGFSGEAINAATSTYLPWATIVDLAIVKDVPVYQRIHHVTEEIYSSGTGFLISAGGLATGLAYPVTGIPFIDRDIDDRGSGVTTTLFLTGDATPGLSYIAPPPAPPPAGLTPQQLLDRDIFQLQQTLVGSGVAPPVSSLVPFDTSLDGIYAAFLAEVGPAARTKTTLGEFIRIKGEYHLDIDTSGKTPQPEPTYDNNLCVWDGFACGTNLELGPMATDCAAIVSTPMWTFIDSQQCSGRKTAPRTFIAVFQKSCPANQGCTNYGLFEVIDASQYQTLHPPAPGDDLFANFQAQVAGDNASLATMSAGTGMVAEYRSARKQKIQFSCWGHESGSDNWGILHVDDIATHGLGAWPFAGGEWTNSGSILRAEVQTPMRGIGDGLIEITSPRLKSLTNPANARVLRLDFTNRDHPQAPAEK